LPAEEPEPPWPEGVDVLGRRRDDDVQFFWVQCPPGMESDLESVLTRQAVVRRVGLETFYLALTRHGRPTETSHPQTEGLS
jgi:hypothetical protein